MNRKIWIDADNPPQAQYLAPLVGAFRDQGCDVLLTARDHAPTLAVLEARGLKPIVLGKTLGASTKAKIIGNLGRIRYLSRAAWNHFGGRPDALVVGQARGAILTAGLLRVPSFVILDYEAVEIRSMKWTGATILHPEVVPAEGFIARGFPRTRVWSFPGLKEDLTYAGLETENAPPAVLPKPHDPNLISVLIRPPSQTCYYRSETTVDLLADLLDHLAKRTDTQVVFSAREPEQLELLKGRNWAVEPVILPRPLPLVNLLKAVDWVVTGGGTMVREAAWLGVHGVSIFTGVPPAIDVWLEARGSIQRVLDPASAAAINWSDRPELVPVTRHPEAVDSVVSMVLSTVAKSE